MRWRLALKQIPHNPLEARSRSPGAAAEDSPIQSLRLENRRFNSGAVSPFDEDSRRDGIASALSAVDGQATLHAGIGGHFAAQAQIAVAGPFRDLAQQFAFND